LKSSSTNFIQTVIASLCFEVKEIAIMIEMGFNAQESFTEMNKEGDVCDTLGV
jgi:hypothetical protein